MKDKSGKGGGGFRGPPKVGSAGGAGGGSRHGPSAGPRPGASAGPRAPRPAGAPSGPRPAGAGPRAGGPGGAAGGGGPRPKRGPQSVPKARPPPEGGGPPGLNKGEPRAGDPRRNHEARGGTSGAMRREREPGGPPTRETATNGSYPPARPLYLYAKRSPKGELDADVAEFLKFVNSREGQETIAKAGVFPISASQVTTNLQALVGAPMSASTLTASTR